MSLVDAAQALSLDTVMLVIWSHDWARRDAKAKGALEGLL